MIMSFLSQPSHHGAKRKCANHHVIDKEKPLMILTISGVPDDIKN